MQAATPGYFATLGVPIVRGRAFTNADGILTPRVAIINRSFARRFFPNEDPIGHALLIDDARWQIVGITGDLFHGDVEQLARPEIYRPMQQWNRASAWIAIRTRGDPASIAPAVVAAVGRFDPDIAITRLLPMNELRARDMGSERRMLQLMGATAIAAVLISAIGLYGLISYSVTQRVREFGIRLALGSERAAVLRLVLAHGLRLSAIGTGFGILGAVAGLRVMRTMLFGVSPGDPLTLAGVIGLVSTIALLAACIPARRATRIDPMTSLREE
jgi:predicted permease